MRAVVIFLALLAAAKLGYQEYLFRAATRDAIIGAYREHAVRGLPEGHRQPQLSGSDPQAWANPKTVRLVIGKSSLDVYPWQIDHAHVECPLSQSLPAADGEPDARPALGRGPVRIRHHQCGSRRLAHVKWPARRDPWRLEASIKNRQCAPRPGMPGGTFDGRSSQRAEASTHRSVDLGEKLIVYQHSDLLYWWVVWAYGFLCAALTAVRGMPVTLAQGHKAVLIYPGAWMGISFVMLVLFVLVFTNARARGVKSLVLFLLLVVIGLSVQMTVGWTEILQYFPLLLVHMNLAFYLLFSGVLLAAWLFVIFGSDHSVLLGVRAQLDRHEILVQRTRAESYTSPQVQTSRQSDDIFVHRLLGLWFLGFGTGDIEVRFSTPGPGQKVYFLKNVWRAAHVEKEINRLVA